MKRLRYKKNICLVTSSRADYDLMSKLINLFKRDNRINFTLLITGQHLSKKYGYTYKSIIKKHRKNSKKIDIKVNKANKLSILNSMSNVLKDVGKYLYSKKIDLLVVLGDRYETTSIALAAYINQIKIAHIHGGEKTTGSMDDSFRHVITKLSNLHFVSAKKYKDRVAQLGEEKKDIHVVGGLGSEMINDMVLLNKKKIESKIKIKFNKRNFLIGVNSYLNQNESEEKLMKNIFQSIKKFKDTNYIFTLPNSDVNSDKISKLIYKFNKSNSNSYIFKNLGSHLYISLMKYCDAVIGNSSSGILEAPVIKIPTVNIGKRQDGRLKSTSIINSKTSYKDIFKSIKKSLSNNFKKKIIKTKNIYFQKKTSEKILNIIASINLKKLSYKEFKDIKLK